MFKHIDWLYNFIISSFQNKVLNKLVSSEKYYAIRKKRYAHVYGKQIMSSEEVNKILLDKLANNEPFAVCRNGMWETAILIKLQRDRLWGTKSAVAIDDMFEGNMTDLFKYYDLSRELYKNADFCINWENINMEEYFYKPYAKHSQFCNDNGVSNFLLKDPSSWIHGIEGKKVLVISPFVEYMESQYKKKDLLWEGFKIPDFELHTVKSVFWYDGFKDPRFNSWFEALDYLYNEAMKQDFDIALLGCSTFATPLALRFKQAGKQAVHVGGPLQLLFGIKGKRWDKYFTDTYNEHWISLPDESKVGNVDSLDVEGGSYWS